jgi:hypothetical protein
MLSGLLFCGICLYGCATGPQIEEGVTLPRQIATDEWEHAHSAENQVQRVIEFVRPGQTVDNWTEMFTVLTFNKAFDLGSVEEHVANIVDGFNEHCPGTTLEVIRQMPDGVIYEVNIVNCEQGPDEQSLVRILDGDYNRFAVQYAVRGTVEMTTERRAEWFEEFMDLSTSQY